MYPEVLLAYLNKFFVFDDSVVVGVDGLEEQSEFVSFLLGDLLEGEVLFDDCDEVVAALGGCKGTWYF